MRIEFGTVVEERAGKVLVEAVAESFCESCSARGSCSTKTGSVKKTLWIDNTLNAVTGDTVTFGIEEKGVMTASALLYLLPVALLLLGAVAGGRAAESLNFEADLCAAAGGGLGLLMFIPVLLVVMRIKKNKNVFAPVLLSKTSS